MEPPVPKLFYHEFRFDKPLVPKLFYFRFDEKRYTSACIEPPVPKLFFAQLDALNDCLVIENLEKVTLSLYSKTTLNVHVFYELKQHPNVINNNCSNQIFYLFCSCHRELGSVSPTIF
jgi:hypothetical protein